MTMIEILHLTSRNIDVIRAEKVLHGLAKGVILLKEKNITLLYIDTEFSIIYRFAYPKTRFALKNKPTRKVKQFSPYSCTTQFF